MILRLYTLPSADLTENKRRSMHYRQYAAVLKREKELFYPLLQEAGYVIGLKPKHFFKGRVNLTYRFHFTDARMRDRDGLAQRIKAVQDMLCQPKGAHVEYKLGIIIDDSDKYVNDWIVLPTAYKAAVEMLEITIEGAE